jgi:fructokinase
LYYPLVSLPVDTASNPGLEPPSGQPIVALGEILWDLFPDGRRLGGAPLNFSAHARQLGHPVSLISALGDDLLGNEAAERIRALGLDCRFVQSGKRLPTGTAGVRLGPDGSPQFEILRPAAYDALEVTADLIVEIERSETAWFYFGSLFAATPEGRATLEQLLSALNPATKFLDLNLRPGGDAPELVMKLLGLADVVKLNAEELERVQALAGLPQSLEPFGHAAVQRFGWQALAVTRGDRGCAIWADGNYAEAPGLPVNVVDTVGAGDAFAAAFVHGLSQLWPAGRIADFANRRASDVAGRAGALPIAIAI